MLVRLHLRLGTLRHVNILDREKGEEGNPLTAVPAQSRSTQETHTNGFLTRSQVLACSVTLISTIQGVYFALATPSTVLTVTALFLALSTVFLAKRLWSTTHNRVLWLTLLLASSQLAVLVATLIQSDARFSFRLLLVALLLSYFATALTALLATVVRLDLHKAVLLSFSTAVALFVSEAVLALPGFQHTDDPFGPEWVGPETSPHPLFGTIYRPGSSFKTYYPDNPRGYFEAEDPRQAIWWLRVAAEGKATLVMPPDSPDVVRLAITKAAKEKWDVQLNKPRYTVRAHHLYTIAVTARADSPRTITVGFALAHAPWANLGLYQTIELTSTWQRFQLDFAATADDDNARIHVDAGNSDIAVELSAVTLRSRPDGTLIEPDRSDRQYYVSYQLNSLGCRGRDYAIPRPAGAGRIVLIGDSFTQGIGVHERDTFGSQLERLLNATTKAVGSFEQYDVINCGVSGFGTRDERLFYEEFGARYEPQIVLLVMVSNDEMSFREEVERGYVLRRRGRAESLSYIWRQIEDYRHRRPFPDYRRCVAEIHRLNTLVRDHGARLGVIIFRTKADYGGNPGAAMLNELTRTVTAGLQGTDIPLLDLGPAFLAQHPDEQLHVHEIDLHPNEIAHRTAAKEILEFLLSSELFRPR